MEIEQLLIAEKIENSEDVTEKRDQLLSLALTGKTKTYLGENLTPEQVKSLTSDDVIKHYDRYISSLGNKLSKSLSQTIVNLYAKGINYFFPQTSESDLCYDLEKNPIINDTLSNLSGHLYIRFGALLAPIVLGMITASHLKFNFERDHKELEQVEENVESKE